MHVVLHVCLFLCVSIGVLCFVPQVFLVCFPLRELICVYVFGVVVCDFTAVFFVFVRVVCSSGCICSFLLCITLSVAALLS